MKDIEILGRVQYLSQLAGLDIASFFERVERDIREPKSCCDLFGMTVGQPCPVCREPLTSPRPGSVGCLRCDVSALGNDMAPASCPCDACRDRR